MPHDDFYADSEQARAAVSKARGKAAARIKDPAERRAYVARQGKVEMLGGKFAPIIRKRFLEHGKEDSGTEGVYSPHNSPLAVGIGPHIKYER